MIFDLGGRRAAATTRKLELLEAGHDALHAELQSLADRLSKLEGQVAVNNATHAALILAERVLGAEAQLEAGQATFRMLEGKLAELAEGREGDSKNLDALKAALRRLEHQSQLDAEDARRAAAGLLQRMELTRPSGSAPKRPRDRPAGAQAAHSPSSE